MGERLSRITDYLANRDFTGRAATWPPRWRSDRVSRRACCPQTAAAGCGDRADQRAWCSASRAPHRLASRALPNASFPGTDKQSFNSRRLLAASANGVAVAFGLALQRPCCNAVVSR